MEFIELDHYYLQQATELSYKNYRKAYEYNPNLPLEGRKDFIYEHLAALFQGKHGIVMVQGGELLGFLAFYEPWNKKQGGMLAKSALYGYGIREDQQRDQVCSLLFQHAAKHMVEQGVDEFEISVFSTDSDMIHVLQLNNFGILCTECIMSLDVIIDVSERRKYRFGCADVSNRMVQLELLDLYHQLVHHLQCSPTFYPGYEFTDELYLEYIQDPNTKVFTARTEGRLVGMIDASVDEHHLIGTKDIIFTGDVFFLPEERGFGGAQGLLDYVRQYYLGQCKAFAVEHGTTNPNAIRFWDRYYNRYAYTLNRKL